MHVALPELPTGTVTLLFSDVDRSTELVKRLGERYGDLLAEHRRFLREAFGEQRGIEIDTATSASVSTEPRESARLPTVVSGRSISRFRSRAR